MAREELRDAMGMVLQDTWLFEGTIEENLAYGADSATHEQVARAAEAARADRFIRTLPGGYDTVLSDEGSQVSAGEKQLLTIARAFLSEPSILILDDGHELRRHPDGGADPAGDADAAVRAHELRDRAPPEHDP